MYHVLSAVDRQQGRDTSVPTIHQPAIEYDAHPPVCKGTPQGADPRFLQPRLTVRGRKLAMVYGDPHNPLQYLPPRAVVQAHTRREH